MQNDRPVYDCDTSSYWCSESDYQNSSATFGRFIEDGRAYEITTRNTPRPWLNYLCNDRFASCVSNTGLGFTWYKTSLLRITKYEHEIDYLPREFKDGREVILEDLDTGESWSVFRDASNVRCIHRPGLSEVVASHDSIDVSLRVFVPLELCGECWLLTIRSTDERQRRLRVRLQQTWTFSKFGIHTAEEGIPYLTTPGEGLTINTDSHCVHAHSWNPKLPVELYGVFFSPEAQKASCSFDEQRRKDGRLFRFPACQLELDLELEANGQQEIEVFSGADESPDFPQQITEGLQGPQDFEEQLEAVLQARKSEEERISCQIPEKNIQNFLNVWFKNQLFLSFRFVRSGYIGYRDTLQDTWGYTLVDPEISRQYLLRTLSHMRKDGVCPRNYSIIDDAHDFRTFMDSGSWIARTVVDWIKETGDFAILDEQIPWIDDETPATVQEHILRSLDMLFEQRGRYGLCLTGDGDWNDALEGISRSGDAVSAWLTMAAFEAHQLMAELFQKTGNQNLEKKLRERAKDLKQAVNQNAWDGDWYVYGYTGSGKPIGSKKNREGSIHLNAQTWAVFTGIADEERITRIYRAMEERLDTKFGPTLLEPPYAEEADEVGRIAKLEPGTFENGSIYQHAVAFRIFADLSLGKGDEAADLFARMLPTNPENFDARRTSEPYCTGNYYCGPTHPRFGQNFFTWFTGNPAWLLRAGFDMMLGVSAGFDGLTIAPCVPEAWESWTVTRTYRGCRYDIQFQRDPSVDRFEILTEDVEVHGNVLLPCSKSAANIVVKLPR